MSRSQHYVQLCLQFFCLCLKSRVICDLWRSQRILLLAFVGLHKSVRDGYKVSLRETWGMPCRLRVFIFRLHIGLQQTRRNIRLHLVDPTVVSDQTFTAPTYNVLSGRLEEIRTQMAMQSCEYKLNYDGNSNKWGKIIKYLHSYNAETISYLFDDNIE